ncbi:unnamed protein product [Periconia digitata]|uniref:Uncharacterized protein n=1 Tax=Periconia digitata TaxID=1303443 RepID=A0A9W4XE10_9PLEO|nr:unnamed protein product [Periconia digitata]
MHHHPPPATLPAPSSQTNNPPQHSNHQEYSEKDAYAGRQPFQQSPHAAQRGSKGSSRSRAHDSVMSAHPLSPKSAHTSPPSPTASLHRTIPEIDQQQQISPATTPIAYPQRAYIDPEKAAAGNNISSSNQRSPRASNQDVRAVVYDSGEYHEKGPEDKPVQLLLFLSGPCALLSIFIALWTILALFILALVQPFRLLSSRSTKSVQLTTFLAAPLNLQLHLIYSYATSTDYSSPMLVVINLFSPFVAAGVAIAAWTAAFFWFFSAILGDPAGQDGRNDGKESILGVRNWWERWLSRALR